MSIRGREFWGVRAAAAMGRGRLLLRGPAPELLMMSNVYCIRPRAAAHDQAEPVEAAVRELSARIATNNEERRRLFSRLNELRGLTTRRRRRARPSPPAMAEPVTFYSIEEAEASASIAAPLQVARGGR